MTSWRLFFIELHWIAVSGPSDVEWRPLCSSMGLRILLKIVDSSHCLVWLIAAFVRSLTAFVDIQIALSQLEDTMIVLRWGV